MRIKGKVARLLAAAALAMTMTGGTLVTAAAPAAAAPTSCKTLHLSGNWQGFAINPRMSVPICYNGSSVWPNGNVTPGVSTAGWYVGGFDWAGTYGGGGWLGAGDHGDAVVALDRYYNHWYNKNMLMKKTILAIVLNILFGGVGYLYLKEPTRKPLAIFLIFVTVYEFLRNIYVMSNPATQGDAFAIHTLPMLSLFGSIPGTIILTIMAVDVYFLVKRQMNRASRSKSRTAKAA